MEEVWEQVPGYEGHYLVSNSGKVYSLKSEITLKPNIIHSGYKMIRLSKNGWSRNYLIHRIVAEVFCMNDNKKPVVNHKDGDKLNNYFLNLEWVTDSENQLHAIRTGLRKVRKNEEHPMSKLNSKQVKEIKDFHERGYTYKQISNIFKVHFSTIARIINNQLWKDVE